MQVDKAKMIEMFSQQNEKVEFEHPVEAKGMRVMPICNLFNFADFFDGQS